MKKNEQGYALLLVLFLVVFIMAISAVFMRGALNNAKQEQTVDKNHLVVTAAEMGVEYYETALANEYYKEIERLKKREYNEIERKKEDEDIKYDDIRKRVTQDLREHLKGYLGKDGIFEIIKTYHFSSKDWESDSDDENGIVIITGTVTGEKEKAEGERDFSKDLTYRQTFLVPSFDPNLPDVLGPPPGFQPIDPEDFFSNGLLPGADLTAGNEKYKDGLLEIGTKLDIDDSELYVGGYLTVGADLNLKKSSELYAGGYLAAGTDLNLHDSKLYAGGYLTVGAKMHLKNSSELYVGDYFKAKNLHIHKSKLYVGKGFTVTEDFDMNDSKLYVGKIFTTTGNFKMNDSDLDVGAGFTTTGNFDMDDSKLYVGANFTTTGNLKVDDSKLCVVGNLTVTGKIDIDKNSKVYVLGTSNKFPEVAERLIIEHNPEEFKKICGASGNIPTPPKIEVEY